MTKRVDTEEDEWRNWNWRSDGDIMGNGAFFVASGDSVEIQYEKAYSVEPKSANFIDQLTMNAGVLVGRSLIFKLSFTFSLFSFSLSSIGPLLVGGQHMTLVQR